MSMFLDFETEPIAAGQRYGPRPFGAGVAEGDGNPEWLDLPNREYDLCSAILGLESGREPLVVHNAQFEIPVMHHLGREGGDAEDDMPEHVEAIVTGAIPVHDTAVMAYLHDPLLPSYGLKNLAREFLGREPVEQTDLLDWLAENWGQYASRHGLRRVPARSKLAAYICEAPPEMVKPYCLADVAMTRDLYHFFLEMRKTWNEGLRRYFDEVETPLAPILARARVEGIRICPSIVDWCEKARLQLERMEETLRSKLFAPSLEFSKPSQLVDALLHPETGQCDPYGWELTPSGQRTASKDFYMGREFRDPEVKRLLDLRSVLEFSLKQVRGWLDCYHDCGRLHPVWRSTPSGSRGSVTSRMTSSDPCVNNIAKRWKAGLGVPSPRTLLLADEGCRWVCRDFSGQEMRIVAHYEQDELCRAFQDNPELDPHGMMKEQALEQGFEFPDPSEARDVLKRCNFISIYVGGAPALSKALFCTVPQARMFLGLHKRLNPGLYAWQKAVQDFLLAGGTVYTLGGRRFETLDPEVARRVVNYLIQGSAAEMTKTVLVRMARGDRPFAAGTRMLCTVYDEINLSVPEGCEADDIQSLGELMEDFHLRVPMRSTAEVGNSWGGLKPWQS